MKQDDIRSCRDLDERLAPYVDGEATPDARRAVDSHMAACPPCRDRMESERMVRDVLHDHRTGLRGAAPAALRARCLAARVAHGAVSPSLLRRWLPLSLAASVILAVGVVFVLGINDGVEALAAGLTLDHVSCFRGSSATVKTAAAAEVPLVDARSASVSWQQSQGWPITVPETAPAENLRLVDVRRCLSTDGRVAHLMYLWDGKPLSVYVLPRAVAGDRVFETMGHEAAIWSANGRTYAVLAAGHPSNFDHIVGYVKAHAR
jgi:anti-sigma factor (TIGR02949 family)